MACIKIFPTSNLFRQSKILLTLSKNMSSVENDVVFETINKVGVITLNRPKVLNSLNLSMVRKIYPTLKKWENEQSVIVIKGAGEKAFCAGGDIKAIAEAGLKGENLGADFFKEEYSLNGFIGRYKLPYVAIIHGITMGGGVGLSVHGRYRVATEKTLFAMPETAIGLFSDVGGSYFLPRLKGKLGTYLALTGDRLKGRDVVRAGVATHYCESNNLNNLLNDLYTCNKDEDVKTVLSKHQPEDKGEFSLTPHLKKIDDYFSAPDIETIFTKLGNDDSKWATDTLNNLKKMSPTSLKIVLEEMKRGGNLSREECLEMEYKMAIAVLNGNEFFEGVRALLIDKDQNPKWKPSTVAEVTPEIINRHFPQDDVKMLNKL